MFSPGGEMNVFSLARNCDFAFTISHVFHPFLNGTFPYPLEKKETTLHFAKPTDHRKKPSLPLKKEAATASFPAVLYAQWPSVPPLSHRTRPFPSSHRRHLRLKGPLSPAAAFAPRILPGPSPFAILLPPPSRLGLG